MIEPREQPLLCCRPLPTHSLRFNFLALTLQLHNTLDQCIAPLAALGAREDLGKIRPPRSLWPITLASAIKQNRCDRKTGHLLRKGSSGGWRGGAWRKRER